jgi:asparagine synthase (glutamine-hydrolysing)
MLDRDVVEFAWTIPMEYKTNGTEGKLVLKDVLYRYVPKEMMDRPKKGFSIPITDWLRCSELRDWAEALLDKDVVKRQGILNPDEVWRIWRDFIDNGNWRIQIWYILMFQSWMMDRELDRKL